MDKENAEVLQDVLDLYICRKIDLEDEEYIVIMKVLWERLKKTYKLRVVK